MVALGSSSTNLQMQVVKPEVGVVGAVDAVADKPFSLRSLLLSQMPSYVEIGDTVPSKPRHFAKGQKITAMINSARPKET